MYQNNDGISIQVGLSGYSFRLEADGERQSSGWMGADRVFTTPQLQKRYETVEISLFTPKATLVPEQFYDHEQRRRVLSDVVRLEDGDSVEAVEVPEFGAVLVYSVGSGKTLSKLISETVLMTDGTRARIYPEHYRMLKGLSGMHEYNKIVASYADGYLYLVIAQGSSLLLCNSFKAPDFTTAEYFIFLAMKKLQLNPEVSVISFRTPLEADQEMSLYRYFKSVEQI